MIGVIGKVSLNSDEVIANYKLKDYLTACIDAITEQVLESSKKGIPDEVIHTYIEHRNMLLCIKEICKARNKF